MRTWLTRGAVLAVVHAAAAVTVATLRAADPTGWTTVQALALGSLVAAAAVWAAVDGWRGLPDRGRTWVLAALVAGWGSAVLTVVGRGALVDQTGVSALGSALTGGAAFTALVVLVPAGVGLVVGPRLDRRTDPPADEEQPHRVIPPRPSPRPRAD